jgi:hypothetical protein
MTSTLSFFFFETMSFLDGTLFLPFQKKLVHSLMGLHMLCNFFCSELEPLCMCLNVCVRARIFSYVNLFSPLLAHTLVHPHVHTCLCVLALFPVPISTHITRAVQLGSVILAASICLCVTLYTVHCRLDGSLCVILYNVHDVVRTKVQYVVEEDVCAARLHHRRALSLSWLSGTRCSPALGCVRIQT